MQTQAKNKNILFIGPYRQNDGWGLAAKDYVQSLLTTPHNIHCQPIYMSNNISPASDINQQILACENNSLSEYDIVIQNVLPDMVCKTPLRNIGLFYIENDKFFSDSIFKLNLLDEIWVSSNMEKNSLLSSGIKPPIKVIGHPIVVSNPTSAHTSINLPKLYKDYYKFYFIGEHIQRKNIKDIILAFNLEFDITENVALIIKTSVPGLQTQDSYDTLIKEATSLKQKIRFKKSFHKELFITHRLTDKELADLHNLCDCFITTSYGEAICRPAAEALCAGNPVILSKGIGLSEYIDTEDKFIIESYSQPVLLNNPQELGLLDIYNANERWQIPCIDSIKKQMRHAYNTRHQTDYSKYKQRFSPYSIGRAICEAIA